MRTTRPASRVLEQGTAQREDMAPFIQLMRIVTPTSCHILFGCVLRRGTVGGDIERMVLRGNTRIEVRYISLLIRGRSVSADRASEGVILRRSSCCRHPPASGAASPPPYFLFAYPYRILVHPLPNSPRNVESYSSLQDTCSRIYVAVIRGGRYSLEYPKLVRMGIRMAPLCRWDGGWGDHVFPIDTDLVPWYNEVSGPHAAN